MKSTTKNTVLLEKIRPVTEEDKKLPVYSYSGLSSFKKCPYQFNLTYIQRKRQSDSSLAMQLGTLLHYVLEQKGRMLTSEDHKVDYDVLNNILINGTTITDKKTKEAIIGLKQLKSTYWDTWGFPDTEGRSYNDKMVVFDQLLHEEMERDDWKPYLFEYPFTFVYDNKIILHGYIDRVDVKNVDGKEVYRVIDYKTNKKPFDVKELATALQFGIYALAILNDFKSVPIEYQYRMILLDIDQNALTLGWEKRLVTALDKIIKELDESKINNKWIPKPSPLCHWCDYCKTNSDAKEFKYECPYHSLWTPDNKVFDVNMKYDEMVDNNNKYQSNNTGQTLRKVVF